MRIILLTRADPFYLAENLDFLLSHLPFHSDVVATVLFEVSPFGKRESFFEKMKRTYQVFGFKFFMHYGSTFLFNKLKSGKNVSKVLQKYKVPVISLNKGVT